MRQISTVTFDLWHTLVKELPGSTNKVSRLRIDRIADLLESAGMPQDIREIEDAYRKTGTFLELTWTRARDIPARDHVLFMLNCIECRLPGRLGPENVKRVERIYAEALLEHPPALIDGAKEVLEDLRREGYRLGLISNTGKTPGSTLRILLDRLGVFQHFQVTTFSDEVTFRKPSEITFGLTLNQLRTPPKAAVHIGDDPDKDVNGARACGMRAIQVAWPEVPRSDQADRYASRLEDIPEAVSDLEKELSVGRGLHRG